MPTEPPRRYSERIDEPGCSCEACAQARLITRLSDALAEMKRERDLLSIALAAAQASLAEKQNGA